MSGMQFLVDFAGALAWPAALVVVVAFLRRPIIDILMQLASGLRRLRSGQSDAEFDRIVSLVKAELTATVSADLGPPVPALLRFATLAEDEPAAAIAQSCAAVEAALRDLLTSSGKLVPAGGGDPAAVARFARDQRLVPESVVQAVDGVVALRNQAASDPARVTRQHARQYLALIDAVVFAIGRPSGRILASQPPAGMT
jgi:hypothetical protein